MQADIDVTGYQPDLVVSKNLRHVIVQCEIIDQLPAGPQRTGKYIHLGLTPTDAVRLLSLLQTAQKQFGWPAFQANPPVASVYVPPASDRN